MGMPLFLPSDFSRFHYPDYYRAVVHSRKYGVVAANYTVDTVRFPLSPFESTSLEATELWSHTQTYFEYPHVQFFASNAELLRTLPEVDLPLLSHRMRSYHTDLVGKAMQFWTAAFAHLLGRGTPEVPPQPGITAVYAAAAENFRFPSRG